jgi:hypothetical protein
MSVYKDFAKYTVYSKLWRLYFLYNLDEHKRFAMTRRDTNVFHSIEVDNDTCLY